MRLRRREGAAGLSQRDNRYHNAAKHLPAHSFSATRAIQTAIDFQQLRQIDPAILPALQHCEQPCGLVLHRALAVKTVARVVNKFHRAEAVEPTKEPLADRVLA